MEELLVLLICLFIINVLSGSLAFARPGLGRTSDQSGSVSSPSALTLSCADKKLRTRPRVLQIRAFLLCDCVIVKNPIFRASDVLCAQARCSVVAPPSREPSVKPWACWVSSWLVHWPSSQPFLHLLFLWGLSMCIPQGGSVLRGVFPQ